MIVFILTFLLGGLLARWLSLTLPRGRWYTFVTAIAGFIVGPIIGFFSGTFVAFALQKSPEYDANALLGTGLVCGVLWAFTHPVATWVYRRQRARVEDDGRRYAA